MFLRAEEPARKCLLFINNKGLETTITDYMKQEIDSSIDVRLGHIFSLSDVFGGDWTGTPLHNLYTERLKETQRDYETLSPQEQSDLAFQKAGVDAGRMMKRVLFEDKTYVYDVVSRGHCNTYKRLLPSTLKALVASEESTVSPLVLDLLRG